MNTSRRDFLKKSALAAVAGTTLFSDKLLAMANPRELVGVQLYSIREEMKKDPVGNLKLLAAMGYKNVEHANYVERKFYGHSAIEFKKVLDGLGLKMPSGHTVMGKQHWDETKKDFTDAWKYTVEDAAMVGQQLVITGWRSSTLRYASIARL